MLFAIPKSMLGSPEPEAHVKVGIPREVKNREYRVAITAAGVRELFVHGHEVFVQKDAGVGSSITDQEFMAAGATILGVADDVSGAADLVLKVREPIAEEYHRMRSDQVLFTYLHLAASRECTDAPLASGITRVAYETGFLPDLSLLLLGPMSEVAGRVAPQVGAHCVERVSSGRGVLMGGVSGVHVAKVVVLDGGVSGLNAAAIALGMLGEMLLLDKSIGRPREVSTGSTRAICRPSRRTPTRSSGSAWTRTSSSARFSCQGRRPKCSYPTTSSRR